MNVSEMKQLLKLLEKNWLEAQSELRRLKAVLEEIAEGNECRECGGESQSEIAKKALVKW
jgi:hypothetical protein